MTNKFRSLSHEFKIDVETDFDFDQSNPMLYNYMFRYTITIMNTGKRPAKLISRKWFIKDGKGNLKNVEGPGVIGATPHFPSGGSFEYQSFCPLPTMEGEMWGYFNMIYDNGEEFQIHPPTFKFSVPKEYIDVY